MYLVVVNGSLKNPFRTHISKKGSCSTGNVDEVGECHHKYVLT